MNRIFALLAFLAFCVVAHPANAQDAGPPAFQDNPGICMINPLAAPRLVPGTKEWDFRTRISEGTNGICANFDGAFTVVTWGCGTSCEQGVMVDRTDGKIYWLPDVASYGLEYHGESNVLVVNAFISKQFEFESESDVPDWLWREYYVFDHGNWKLKYQDKGFDKSSE